MLRGAFGKFLAWSLNSVTNLQNLSCLVSFSRAIFPLCYGTNFMGILITDTKNIIVNTCTVCILKTQNFSGKYNILPFEKCAEH